jgi:hypothetical protein
MMFTGRLDQGQGDSVSLQYRNMEGSWSTKSTGYKSVVQRRREDNVDVKSHTFVANAVVKVKRITLGSGIHRKS